MSNGDAALEYLDYGWSIIPALKKLKKPTISWKPYQDTLPTPEEVEQWWKTWPDAEAALITGQLSGIVIVDCDSDSAIQLCKESGIWSPVRVRTPSGGLHLYFTHPRDGTWRGPRVGSNSTGTDWPQFPTLDFRGDGSYGLLPPSRGYTWEIDPGHTLDDMPMWQGWPADRLHGAPSQPLQDGPITLDDLSLADAKVTDAALTEWEATTQYVIERFPETRKIPTGHGNGRNSRVTRFAAQMIVRGYFDEDLRAKVLEFMDHFFEDHLAEWEAICRSLEMAEKRNHPERFDDQGNYVPPVIEHQVAQQPGPQAPPPKSLRLIRMSDADRLITDAGNIRYILDPIIPSASIIQVAGYTGHGKSLLMGHLLSAAASSHPVNFIGPFEIMEPARTLYLNYEEGRGTIGRRLKTFAQVHGDAGDNFQVWTPFLEDDDMPLNEPAGLKRLAALINELKPTIVVIDTIRTAFPGIKENDAESWSSLNRIALKLRNKGITVIFLHHRNKGSDGGNVGREAGSTNQLTTIETQVYVDMVFEDKEKAKSRSAVWDGDYEESVYDRLSNYLTIDEKLILVFQITYGKLREETPNHESIQWIGVAMNLQTGEERIVGSTSPKQRARLLTQNGHTPIEIARALSRPLQVIEEWIA